MSFRNSQSLRRVTRGALIAALYTALTLMLAPISYGAVQVRIAEAFTLLPVIFPEAVPALAIGCLIANILGGCMLPDIVFGTLATLLGALCTYYLRGNRLLSALPPIVFNGLIVGAVVQVCYTPEIPLVLCMLSVGAGEAISVYGCGFLFLKAIDRVPAKYR